jgi:hypothetical protein
MKNLSKKLLVILLSIAAGNHSVFSQNSVLVNLGSASCSSPVPGFFLIKNPLTNDPLVMTACDLSAQLPNYYSTFIAYNPKNNKIYLADIRTFVKTNIWVMDVGLPGSVTCPASIPVTPDYSYDYVSNNFEFDNNGDLWSFSLYDPNTGQCNIDKFDVTTGLVINTRKLQFPDGHFPTTIQSGDLTILPNGRMFATLGSIPSQLYEITNYSGTEPVTATWLQTLPQDCFGIAYLNGNLEITGFNVNGCYNYQYNISNNTLSAASAFQNGQAPIDNTSFSPALGTTKHIVSTALVNSNSVNITYEIYVTNMGNTILNNINVTEDLIATFSPANVSNVHAEFVDGANNAGLTLNPSYDGIIEKDLLVGDQQLPNRNSGNNDYYFKIRVSCLVSNIDKNKIYYNSAIAKAIINNVVDPIYVSDSSNNGSEEMVDPDMDGNAGGINENIPTPFNFTSLPVNFLNVRATATNKGNAISWQVAAPVSNALNFEPQYSADGIHWYRITTIPISDQQKSNYSIEHVYSGEGNLYYRIKQTDIDGQFIYSKVVMVERKNFASFRLYPNPAKGTVNISIPGEYHSSSIQLFDATGRMLISEKMTGSQHALNTSYLPDGTYLLQVNNSNKTFTRKLFIKH